MTIYSHVQTHIVVKIQFLFIIMVILSFLVLVNNTLEMKKEKTVSQFDCEIIEQEVNYFIYCLQKYC